MEKSKILSGIAKHCEGLGKHLDAPVPDAKFLVLRNFGIALLVSSIISGSIT
jgi:hypothetical protein